MPWYNDLRPDRDENLQKFAKVFPLFPNDEKKRTIANLLTLREALQAELNPRKTDNNLLIASWNLKEFGHLRDRTPESIFYIAEIIDKFDLVAIQELKGGLEHFNQLMQLLGKNWEYVINDITEGRSGNKERSAYVYNKHRVSFAGLAGEIVIQPEKVGNKIAQLKRSPFMTGFKAGWKKFALINVHLHPGNKSDDDELRREEIRLLFDVIAKKIESNTLWSENIIVTGDFNLYKDNKTTKDMIDDYGFKEIHDLMGINTNVVDSQAYDRVYYLPNEYFNINDDPNSRNAGVFKLFDHLYKEEGWEAYKGLMLQHKEKPETLTNDEKFKSYFRNHWRKGQLSDHNPIWFEMIVDNSDDFLREKFNRF